MPLLLDAPAALQASDDEVPAPLRVYLVEDQTVLRECLVASLELAPGVVMVGEAADAERALEDHRITDTDVVVMDVGLPGMNGIEATRRLKEKRSDLRVVILTAHENDYLNAAISAGADAIMIHSREKSPDEIRLFCAEYRKISTRVPLVAVPSSYSSIKEAELIELGVNVVIYANQLLRAAYPAMRKVAETILENERSMEAENDCLSIDEILNLIPGTV